jgi:predicted small lipoprotein YifL
MLLDFTTGARSPMVAAMAVALVAAALAGCGIKGPLKPAPWSTPRATTASPGAVPSTIPALPPPPGGSDPGEPEPIP